jgi:hypothetical protein
VRTDCERKRLEMKRQDFNDAVDEIALRGSRGERLGRREELLGVYRDVGSCECGVRRG